MEVAVIKLIGKRDSETEEGINQRGLSDADYDRLAYWAAFKFFPQGVLVSEAIEGDPTADPPVEPVAAVYRQPTGAEVFHALTDNVYDQIKRECESWYLNQAMAAARASVPPIVLEPAD